MNRQPNQPKNITYNISGTNTRVNINSSDSSVNIVNMKNTEIFNQLKKLLSNIESIEEKKVIEDNIQAMENTQGTKDFVGNYRNFMAAIADHITVFAPLLPALAVLLT